MLGYKLTAEDLALLLKKYKYNDSKVSIIGCPEHLFKSLLKDKNKKLKAYICHIKDHWFTIFYFRTNKFKTIITWDSFGNIIPYNYRSKIYELNSDIDFKYCSISLQKDGYSCGLFCITFILLVFECYNNIKTNNLINKENIKEEFLNSLNKIKKRDVIHKLNSIKKVL